MIDRDSDPAAVLGQESVDAVIDVVAGATWPRFLDILKRGGRYATSGAIGGPLVELDLRTLYLKDLTLVGCTAQDDVVFDKLVRAVEEGTVRPLVAATFPLSAIRQAQRIFMAKTHIGKLVLLPPPVKKESRGKTGGT